MSSRNSSSRRRIIPRPDRVRSLEGISFGWIDARMHRLGWLGVLSPAMLCAYTFLCLAADRQGTSFWRRDRMGRELGLSERELALALKRLVELDLVAYEPFHARAADGFHQVLSLPAGDPPAFVLSGLSVELPTID
jgi:hypothetical protein